MGMPAAWYRRLLWQCLLLSVLSTGLYVNTLGHDYALDDAIVITNNTVVQRGVAGLGDLFTHDTFYGFFGEREREALVAGGRYRPLTLAMFALEQQVADGPLLHHLLNMSYYVLLVLLVFGFVRELVHGRPLPWWVPLAVAALFAAHPLHTEAVANIKGRDEIIALLGSVGAAWLVLRAARKQAFTGAVAGAVCFGMACLAKENAITFAAVIPVLLFAVRGGAFRYAIPTLVAAAAFLLLRGSIIGWSLGEPSLELMNNPFLRLENGAWVPLGFFERLPTVLHTLLVYLRLFFVPTGLVHDYYPAAIPLRGWGDWTVWVSLVVHGGLLGWASLHLRSRHMLVAVGVMMYLLTLSVVSNLVFPVGTLMSERFLFMPSLGGVLAVVGLLAKRPALGYAIVPVVLVFGVMTVARNPVWKDNYTLFTTDLPRQPNSAKLLNAAAGARLDRYQQLATDGEAPEQLLALARRDLDRALSIHPTYANAYLLRGNARLLTGDAALAVVDYDRAGELGMSRQTVEQNLLLALQRAGRTEGEERQNYGTAAAYLLRAEQLDPDNYETLRLLGLAAAMSGRTVQAVDYFKRAVEVLPDNAGAWRNYAQALAQSGQLTEAQQAAARARSLAE